MNNIEFIPYTQKFDFQQPEYLTGNYKFANIIYPKNRMVGFQFPANLVSEDFYLQKIVVNEFTQEISDSGSPILIDDTYKDSLYFFFESYDYVSPISSGYYYIYAGSYKSRNIIQVINRSIDDDTLGVTYIDFVDSDSDGMVDNEGDSWVEKI